MHIVVAVLFWMFVAWMGRRNTTRLFCDTLGWKRCHTTKLELSNFDDICTVLLIVQHQL